MTAADETLSRGGGNLPDANRWMGQVRAELERATLSGGDIGVLEKIIERRLKELDRPLLEEAVGKLDRRAQGPQGAFTLLIEIDAWNIRERDYWGQSDKLRKKGEDPSRWHWVYFGHDLPARSARQNRLRP